MSIFCSECGPIDEDAIDEYGDCVTCGSPTYEEDDEDEIPTRSDAVD